MLIRINGLWLVCCLAALTPACAREPVPDAAQIFESARTSALASASCEGDVEVLNALIADGADVNAVGKSNVTPLIWALTCRGLEFNDMRANRVVRAGFGSPISPPEPAYLLALQELLEAGADPNAMVDGDFGPVYPDSDQYWIDGFSPVLIAAEFHEPEVLALLLQYGGDPHAVDGEGETTALMRAYSRGDWLDLSPQLAPYDNRQWRNLHLLLEAGARLEQSIDNKYNVVEIASSTRVSLAAELLREYNYNGDYETIVYNLFSTIELGYPQKGEREELLRFIETEKAIDVDAIWEKYNQPAPPENE